MNKQKKFLSPGNFDGFKDGIYSSPVFNGGTRGMEWERLKLDVTPDVCIKTTVYISDDKAMNKKTYEIKSKYNDLLLYTDGANGRYLRFETIANNSDVCFGGYSLTFPKYSFTGLLPPIYRGNELFDRYTAVYGNLYLDAEERIDKFYKQLDPKECDESMLPRLAEWLGIELFPDLPEERTRKLLSVTALLYRLKGTLNCIKLLFYTLTDEIPVIREKERHVELILKTRPAVGEDIIIKLMKLFSPWEVKYKYIYLDELGGRVLGKDSVLV